MSPKSTIAVVSAILLLCCGCRSNATHSYKDDPQLTPPQLTPLMNAAQHKDLPRVRRLLAEGADVKATTALGQTSLYEAIERRDPNEDNLPVVDALLIAGADPNELEFSTSNPLTVSLTRDYANPSVTLLLLQAGARVSRECPPHIPEDSPLSLATMESSTEVMRELIARGSPVDCENGNGTALSWAALNGEYDRVALLLRSGAEPRREDLAAANTSSLDFRVRSDFMKTRQLLTEALKSRKPDTVFYDFAS